MTNAEKQRYSGTFGAEALIKAAERFGMMPILGHDHPLIKGRCPKEVPMSPFVTFNERCQKNHSQSAERLRERGGLGPNEACAVLLDSSWVDLSAEPWWTDGRLATAKLIDWFRGWGWTQWTLDDATQKGAHPDALEEQFRQMIGALNQVNTLAPKGADFVEKKTLDALAQLVVTRGTRDVTLETVFEEQGVKAHVGPPLVHPFAHQGAKPRKGGVSVTLTGGSSKGSLWITPDAEALRAWAQLRLGSGI